MSSLLLRFAGPQQSWGSSGGVDHRPTDLVPTRTGVLGLLAAALGAPRGQYPHWLEELTVTVRVDKPGRVEVDFHTVGPPPADVAEARTRHRLTTAPGSRVPRAADWVVPLMNGAVWNPGGGEVSTLITHRAYLADAEFLVAVSGADEHIQALDDALRRPVFPMFLGRKAYAPSFPFHLGVHAGTPDEVLSEYPTTTAGQRLRVLPAGHTRGYRVTPPVIPTHLP